jgi:chromate transport protein ChrA
MLLIAAMYEFISGVAVIEGASGGIRAASVAIIFTTAVNTIRHGKGEFRLVITVFAFAAPFFFNANIVVTIVVCGLFSVIHIFLKNNPKKGAKKRSQKEG